MYASVAGNFEILKLLIDKGANVNFQKGIVLYTLNSINVCVYVLFYLKHLYLIAHSDELHCH